MSNKRSRGQSIQTDRYALPLWATSGHVINQFKQIVAIPFAGTITLSSSSGSTHTTIPSWPYQHRLAHTHHDTCMALSSSASTHTTIPSWPYQHRVAHTHNDTCMALSSSGSTHTTIPSWPYHHHQVAHTQRYNDTFMALSSSRSKQTTIPFTGTMTASSSDNYNCRTP